MGRTANVLDLSVYRSRRSPHTVKRVLVLQNSNAPVLPIIGIPLVAALYVSSEEGLLSAISGNDLIFVPSKLEWACPLKTIETLKQSNDCPIVLVSSPNKKDSSFIKKAYAAGVSDTLFTPIEQEELVQIMEVLLKYKLAFSRPS